MKMIAISGAVLCLTAAGVPAFAQDEPARKAATEIAARVPLERATKGAPYSADTLIEGVQALADGNRINRKTTGRVFRDGEGRTRREDDRSDGSVNVSIVDPVAGFSYSLDPQNKIAWRTSIGASGAIMGKVEASQVEQRKLELERSAAGDVKLRTADADARAKQVEAEKITAAAGGRGGGGGGFGGAGAVMARGGGAGGLRPLVTPGPLEHKTIEGVAVEGRKITTVIPAGQVGNEQPITVADEQWRSPELNILVMTRHADPRSGESTYRLTNIVRAEPDPSLFMVPSDYTVKETGIRRMLEASIK